MVFSSEVINNLHLISIEFERIKGYVNFVIFSKDQLDKGQIGYSTNSKGQSLITDEEVLGIVIGLLLDMKLYVVTQ